MSGSHLSRQLFNMIKTIGKAGSKQEEDAIISVETKQLAERLKEKNIKDSEMIEYLIYAIYIELLGHDASFAHIAAINTSQSKSFKLKRLAYLACTLFLHDKSTEQILLVATLQKDLISESRLEIGAALTTLCKIINTFILGAVGSTVYRLLDHRDSWIRKKAVILVHKFYRLEPSSIDEIDIRMKQALCDKDPRVMEVALNYFHTVTREFPNRYKGLVKSMVVILRQVLERRLPIHYEFHRVPAPWIQMTILSILGNLGQYDKGTSEGMYAILGQAMKQADEIRINIGYAIVYQCVKTIILIYPDNGLLSLAANTISRFLQSDDKNLKYVAISGLSLIVGVNSDYVVEHQDAIIECLEDEDETLRMKSLDLLYKMTNYKNVEAIVEKFLAYLCNGSTNSSAKRDLMFKINQLAERFATNKAWFIDTINKLFEASGDLITTEITNSFIRLISDWEDDSITFEKYTIDLYLNTLKESVIISDPLMQIISFTIGCYGFKVITQEQDIIEVILRLTKWAYYPFNSRTKGFILNAIMNLHKVIGYKSLTEIDMVIKKFVRSKDVELMQRGIEYGRLMKSSLVNIEKLLQSVEDVGDMEFIDKYASEKGEVEYNKSLTITDTKVQEIKLKVEPYESPLDTKNVIQTTKESSASPEVKVTPPIKEKESPKGRITESNNRSETKKEENSFKTRLFSGLGQTLGPSIFQSSNTSLETEPKTTIIKPTEQKSLLDLDIDEEVKTIDLIDIFNPKDTPNEPEKKVKPLEIDTKEFGEEWNTYTSTQTETIPNTNKFTTEELGKTIERQGFKLVSLLKDEAILAGILDDCVILLHYMISKEKITFTLKGSKFMPDTAKILNNLITTLC